MLLRVARSLPWVEPDPEAVVQEDWLRVLQTGALEQLRDAMLGLRPPWPQTHDFLVDRAATLDVTGPILPHLAVEAADAIREGARMMRTLHQLDTSVAQQLRLVMGSDAPSPQGPDPVIADQGQRFAGDAPAPGHSGVQEAFGVTTISLNDADTSDFVGMMGAMASGATVVGTAAWEVPLVSIPAGLLAGGASIYGGLATMNRTPAGVRIYMVDHKIVAITGR